MFSIKIDFDEEKFKKSLTNAAFQVAKKGIEEKAASVRCLTHGETARAVFIAHAGNELQYQIHACCESAVESAKAALLK